MATKAQPRSAIAYFFWLSRVLSVVSALLLPNPALATLIDLGDATLDTATSLQWLDPMKTADLAYDDVVGGAGSWYSNGWRHATLNEIGDLLTAYAYVPPTIPGSSNGCCVVPTPNHELVALLGHTTEQPPGGVFRVRGLYDDGDGGLVSYLLLISTTGGYYSTDIVPNDTDPSVAWIDNNVDAHVGHFLVQIVPEPSVAVLLAAGLALLAGFVKNHR